MADKKDGSDTDTSENNSKSFFDLYIRPYINIFYNKTFLLVCLYILLFFYYIVNNIYFENGGDISGFLKNIGIILFILFYICFIGIIVKLSHDMVKSYKNEKNKKANTILSSITTFVILIFILFVIPYTFQSFGGKGMIRAYDPFCSSGKGYINGFYWGNKGNIFKNIYFYVITLPMTINHFFFGSTFFNWWIIPTFFGDGTNKSENIAELKTEHIIDKVLKSVYFIPFLIIALPIILLNKVCNLFSKNPNIIIKYLNPVDWSLMNMDIPEINKLLNTPYITNIPYFNTSYLYWLNIFIITVIIKFMFDPIVFQNGNTNIVFNLIRWCFTWGSIIYLLYNNYGDEKYKSIFNFLSTGNKITTEEEFKDILVETSNTREPTILFLKKISHFLTTEEIILPSSVELTSIIVPQSLPIPPTSQSPPIPPIPPIPPTSQSTQIQPIPQSPPNKLV
jgi:hypothetical protein